jgi:hypothetical protein
MPVRAVEWKLPYTWWEAISIDENKVISLNLRDENNLIIYDSGDDEIYVDLQLPAWIKPNYAFPVGITTGRVLVADDWDVTGTILVAKTTSWDVIKLLYGDDWTLWMDNGTGLFKQIYFKSDVDQIITTLTTYINTELAKKQNWVSSTTAPTNPQLWDLWYNTSTNEIKVWKWTDWEELGWGSWDVQVSTDTGNLLTTGVKLWLGDKADFDNLGTLDSNTIYAPAIWTRTPWVNTLVYYPLETNVNDYSWNNRNLTNNWITFSDWVWVFDWNAIGTYTNNSLWNNLTAFTYSVFANPSQITTWTSYEEETITNINIFMKIFQNNAAWTYDKALWFCQASQAEAYIYEWWRKEIYATWVSTNDWCYLTFTRDWTNMKLYKNWVLASSTACTSTYIWYTQATLGIWNDITSWWHIKKYYGKLSKVIVENKAWTATEIRNYFRQNKAQYWIS